MNSYIKLVQTQLKLFLREPLALFFTIVFPSMFLGFFSIFANGNEPFPGTDYGYIDLQLPALVGMILGSIALNTIPVTTANNRERGIFRRFKATPMPSWQWMAAEITTNFLVALISLIVLVMVGLAVFDLRMSDHWGALLVGFTLCGLSFMAFGYLIASLSPTPRTASTAGQLLYLPMFMLSGAAFPVDQFPPLLQTITQWLPMTHVVMVMQSLWLEGKWVVQSVWVLVGVMLVSGVVAARLFRWE